MQAPYFRYHNQAVETAPEYEDKRFKVASWGGIAWSVLGYEIESDDDTEWTGEYNRTGNILAIMVGDDRAFTLEPDQLIEIEEEDYCPECGQIGCHAIR